MDQPVTRCCRQFGGGRVGGARIVQPQIAIEQRQNLRRQIAPL